MNQTIEKLLEKAGGVAARVRIWKKPTDGGWCAGYGGYHGDATAEDVERLRAQGVRVERSPRSAHGPRVWSVVDCQECGGEFAVVPDGDDVTPVPHAASSPCGMECRGGLSKGAGDDQRTQAHRLVDCPWCKGFESSPGASKVETCSTCGNSVGLVPPSNPLEKVPPGLMAHVGPCGGLCTGSYSPGAKPKHLHAANCVRCAAIAKLGRDLDDDLE